LIFCDIKGYVFYWCTQYLVERHHVHTDRRGLAVLGCPEGQATEHILGTTVGNISSFTGASREAAIFSREDAILNPCNKKDDTPAGNSATKKLLFL